VSLAALVRHLSSRAGLPEALIDVTGLWGSLEGYAISALESPRTSISTLARHFGFDAVETEGGIRFRPRGRAALATLALDDLVASREGEAFELTRGQETELPQALKWQLARADEDYDAALVEARRITVDTTRIASESFPLAVSPEGEAGCGNGGQRAPGDLTIRWTRRSRALVADAWEQVEVPLAEDIEGYDVQILDGSAVKRTLSSSTTSVLYTAAQQTADWGAPPGPGQTLAIRIYQLSNRLGRGTPAAVTLQF
jgi:hypothetical protein